MFSLLSRIRTTTTVVAALLSTFACGGPANNSALFSSGSANATGLAGTDSGGNSALGGAGNASSVGGDGSSAGETSNGGAIGQGGSGEAFGGNPSGGNPNGGMPNTGGALDTAGGGASGGSLSDCSAFGQDAMFDAQNSHCYLAVHDDAMFADARTHCTTLGAHLVTLSDQAENDFVWSLDQAEHWIGATDGKGVKEMTAGTYSWVDGEPFTYTDWSQGQPNASPSSCSDGSGTCYEHCAFQWSGGAQPGEWNDRLCTHTIEAVCEWDGPK